MSILDSFPLFPRLPTELRLKIWDFALIPQVLAFTALSYRKDRTKSAFPEEEVIGVVRFPRNRTGWGYTRLSLLDLPSHSVLAVSTESRNTARELGYRTWKIEDERGWTRNIWWNPRSDSVLLPWKRQERQGPAPEICPTYFWMRLLALQYPVESKLVLNFALHPSPGSQLLKKDYRYFDGFMYQQLQSLVSVENLVIVADSYERKEAQGLIGEGQGEPWPSDASEIQEDAEKTVAKYRERNPRLFLCNPRVRVVDGFESIIEG